MKRITKHLGILLLVIAALVLTAVFLPNRAEAATVDSGSCGSNVSWSISDAGVLTISGYGAMKDYNGDEIPPWLGYMDYIKSINISYGVTSVGDYAFIYCYRATSLTIPGSVKTIGEAAFCLCTSLKTVTIPNGVTTIEQMAFADCSALTSVEISASVSSIGMGAFATGSNLSKIQVSSSNAYYCSDSSGALYNKSKTTLLQVPATLSRYYEIASTTTKIEQFAFYCCKLTSVAIPKGLQKIDTNAFLQCNNLLNVYYRGTKTQWSRINVDDDGNEKLFVVTINYNYTGPKAAAIKSAPDTVYIKTLKKATLTVSATGTDLRYQWQKLNAKGKWVNVSGVQTSSTYQSNTLQTYNDNAKYRCKVTAITGASVYSDPITVRVMGVKASMGPYKAASVGKTVRLTVKLSGDPACQWQYKKPGSSTWVDIVGATSNTLQIKATAENHKIQYRMKATDKGGNLVTSGDCTLYVLNITKQPAAAKVKVGGTATFKVAATGYERTFQWQYRAPGGEWKNTSAEGSKTATLKIAATAAKNGYQYRCMVKDKVGNTIYSKAAKLYVLNVTTQPQTAKVAVGDTAVFKVSATGHGKTYQWQYRASADSPWKNTSATGNKTATLKVPATVSRSAYQYRCVVKDSAGNTVNSKAVSLYVLGIKTQPAAAQAVAGTNAAFKVEATGHGKTYQWQYRTSPEGAWKNAAATGNKTANLKVPATVSRSGYQYRCVIKDSAGNTVYSDAATLYVLGIAAQPQTTSVAAGETAVFTVSATGYGPTYQWQYRASPEAQWQNVTEATAAQLQFTAEIGMNGYEYRCVVTDFLENTVYSEAAALTVTEPPVEEEPPIEIEPPIEEEPPVEVEPPTEEAPPLGDL